jgi:Tfp pilus assembly protein PilX
VLKLPPIYDNEKGIVLSVALLLLAVLTLIGSVVIVTTRPEVKTAGNWNAHIRAFSQKIPYTFREITTR